MLGVSNYDKLCETLERSIKVVSWFPLSEAIRLAQRLSVFCPEYRKNPEEQREDLMDLAEETYQFLQRMQGRDARAIAHELTQLTTQIRLENSR